MIDIRLSRCHIFLVLLLLEGSNADTANYIRGARQLSKDNISKEETTHDQFEHIVKGCVNGHNLKLFADMTVDECAALCNARDGCYGFEYGVAYGGGGVYKPQDCQLQSSSNTAGCNGGYHNLDFYKKERPIDQFDHVVKGCVNGQNLKLYDDMTADECATLCNARDDCYGFEYGVAYGGGGVYMPRDCQLQSSSNTDDCNGGYHNLDFYKKERPIDQFQYTVKGCVNGQNLKLYVDKTVSQCATLCNGRDDCYGFEYGVAYGGGGIYKPRDCQLQSSSNTAGCNGGYHNLDFYKREDHS